MQQKKGLKNTAGIDTSKLAAECDLANLKAGIYKFDTVNVPVDLTKLSDVVKNVYDKLVHKVNNIDTAGFILKSKYDTDKSE